MLPYNQEHLYGNTEDASLFYDNVNLKDKQKEGDHYMSYSNHIGKNEDQYMTLNNTLNESTYDSPKQNESTYDSPKQIQQQPGDTYDTPKNLRQQEGEMYETMQAVNNKPSQNDSNSNKPTPNHNIYGNLERENPLYGNIQSTFH